MGQGSHFSGRGRIMGTFIEGFLGTLGTMVANKKLLASWLILLTAVAGMTGDQVFRTEPQKSLTINNKLDNIQGTLEELKTQAESNSKKLQYILIEQAKVRTELDIRNDDQDVKQRDRDSRRGKK